MGTSLAYWAAFHEADEYLQFRAAQYLRLAEEKGHKTVGNQWYVALSIRLVLSLEMCR